ncbi:FxLYD domain-containing protein [Natronobacterium lacisalsi]|nr:FxLYD domain-containing protein [Halobiforma lacisalsi]
MNRRSLLRTTGVSVAAAVAGCTTADSGREDDETSDGDASSDVGPDLVIADDDLVRHHFRVSACGVGDEATGSGREVIEELYVRATLENRGASRLSRADLRVRVFDAEGTVLNEYEETVRELAPGSSRQFEIMIYEDADVVADYDLSLEGDLGRS